MHPVAIFPKETAECPDPHRAGIRRGDRQAVQIHDLVDSEGAATPLARRLDGRTVRLAGFVAPSLIADPGRFLLTARSLAPCQLCGNIHGAESGLLVEPAAPAKTPAAMHEAAMVSGRLRLERPEAAGLHGNAIVALVDAVVQPPEAPASSDARAWLRAYLEARPPHRCPGRRRARNHARRAAIHRLGRRRHHPAKRQDPHRRRRLLDRRSGGDQGRPHHRRRRRRQRRPA